MWWIEDKFEKEKTKYRNRKIYNEKDVWIDFDTEFIVKSGQKEFFYNNTIIHRYNAFKYFLENKKEDENFWICELPLERCFLNDLSVTGFFQNFFNNNNSTISLEDHYNWKKSNKREWVENWEIFMKASWLSKEYVDNNFNFDTPFTGHRNLFHNFDVLHPGGMRQRVMRLFQPPESIWTFYHSRNKSEEPPKKDRILIDNAEKICEILPNSSLGIPLFNVGDNLIPHVLINTQDIIPNIYKNSYNLIELFNYQPYIPVVGSEESVMILNNNLSKKIGVNKNGKKYFFEFKKISKNEINKVSYYFKINEPLNEQMFSDGYLFMVDSNVHERKGKKLKFINNWVDNGVKNLPLYWENKKEK